MTTYILHPLIGYHVHGFAVRSELGTWTHGRPERRSLSDARSRHRRPLLALLYKRRLIARLSSGSVSLLPLVVDVLCVVRYLCTVTNLIPLLRRRWTHVRCLVLSSVLGTVRPTYKQAR